MKALIVLLYNNKIYHCPAMRDDEVSFGTGKRDDVFVEGFQPDQISVTVNFDSYSVSAQKAYGFQKKQVPFNTVILLDEKAGVLLFAAAVVDNSVRELRLPYDGVVKLGRAEDNDVIVNLPFISSHHVLFRVENGVVRAEDNRSTNGTYLNGRRITAARMDSGDVLSLMSINIKLLNGVLYIKNAGKHCCVKPIFNYKSSADSIAVRKNPGLVYRRSPRAKEKLPDQAVILANAPSKAQKFERGRGMISSVAGSGALLATSLLAGAASPALLAARAASMISPVANAAANSGTNKKRRKNADEYEAKRREKYGAYIINEKTRIEAVASQQRRIISRENPGMDECLEIASGLKRSLWERTPADEDFLNVRIGMGYEPLCVEVKTKQDPASFRLESDEIQELAAQIIEETRIVDNIPARVSLIENTSVGIVGNREKELGLVRNMLVSLCTAHCYEDVRLMLIADESERSVWESVRWLPHIWDEEKRNRMLFFGREDAHCACEYVKELVLSRKDDIEPVSGQRSGASVPYYIVIFASSGLIEREEALNYLFGSEPAGLTCIFVFDDVYHLPHQCRFIVSVDNDPAAYNSSDASRKKYFTLDEPVSAEAFDSYARGLSAVELEGYSGNSAIPNSVGFLEGFDAERVEELDAFARWSGSAPYNSLSAPIGRMSGSKTFSLDIHEKVFGPHGLVAGTTGSGKSELLQTWILSMALNYHPYDVSFVLIDYKGGSMASALEPLPHVVGKITNIGSNINRALISLQSEQKRRLKLFDEAGVNHIDKYQRLYRNGSVSEPLPHLIIVADEFAELKKEQPDFMSGLISASRLGRSLGIHLVLATQKPGGIVDEQIQSNSHFYICLKVQDSNDSREMLKRPDAAKIITPGRAYIRVGEDEYFDCFQSFYSGCPYSGKEEKRDADEFTVSLVDYNGTRHELAPKRPAKQESGFTELDAVVDYLARTAVEHNIRKLPGPWLPELPEKLSLFELEGLSGAICWPQIPVGIYDLPRLQTQGVRCIDLISDGHLAVYGASGMGKTTFLKTVLMSIGLHYSPEEFCAYVIDAGGWSMSAFKGMPNVGDVVLDREEEKVKKLIELISGEFEERKRLFLMNSVSSIRAYREDVSDKLPIIAVIVDNIVPLFELFSEIEEFFINITRDGAAYGIYLIYTANSPSGVRYKIVQNIRNAIAFELNDKGDYSMLVGRPDSALPKNPGRAFFKGNPPIEVQCVLPFSCSGDREMTELIRSECSRLEDKWNGPRPKRVPIMPDMVTDGMLDKNSFKRYELPVGIAFDTIRPFAFDLSVRYSLLITGSVQSGKSRVLEKIIRRLCLSGNTDVLLFDSVSGRLSACKEQAKEYAAASDGERITEILNGLVAELNIRKKKQIAAKADSESFDEQEYAFNFRQSAIVIDDLKEFIDSVSNENRDTMERICRMAGGLGIIVICAGRLADISRYNEIESLTRVIVANQNGLAVGGKPAQYQFFINDLKYSDKELPAGEGCAYAFSDGKCRRLKLPAE